MTRIVVVSRNPSLAWGLAAPERDLEEVRPHQIDVWLENADQHPADLVVLDLTDAAHSLTILTTLRANAYLSPALLVAGDDPSWEASPLHDLPGAEVLPLPVTTNSLQAAVERLIQAALPHAHVEPQDDGPAEEAAGASGQAADQPEPESSDDPPVTLPVPEQRTGGVGNATPAPPTAPSAPGRPSIALRKSHRTSDAVRQALAGANFSAQVAEVAGVTQSSTDSPATAPDAAPDAPTAFPRSDKPARGMDNANALARALTLRVDELYTVPETAEVIVSDALDRTSADSAVLLLPDGDRWRVAAGIGLGNIERRFELGHDSWVVTNVARASKGVIVAESDVARRHFANAPLSSRKHLLAAPIRLVEGILLVSRDGDPGFTEDALVTLATLADEAGLLIAAALDVRDLARRLHAFTDYGD
jgi:hypothetical protein